VKIVVASVQVPFITGGAEIHAGSLRDHLERRGHQAQVVTIPFKWYPGATMRASMDMAAAVDLTQVNGEVIDRVIALKFPMYYLSHPHKIVWLLHQHRQAYDLWDTPHSDLQLMPEGEAIRREIIRRDTEALGSAARLFTNSATVSRRLLKFNGLRAAPLYHPPQGHEQLRCDAYEDFVFFPSRVDPLKRQALLARAAALLNSPIKVVMAGEGSVNAMAEVQGILRSQGLEGRVTLMGRVTRTQLLDLYARCRAVYFGGLDEDYGYVPLEGMLAAKPVIVHTDGGGPLEFIRHDSNGYVVPPEPAPLAAALDALSMQPELARRLGEQGRQDLHALDLNWDHVIDQLLA
jgi:glycosyltransferase involved in cell wall biosynthesis